MTPSPPRRRPLLLALLACVTLLGESTSADPRPEETARRVQVPWLLPDPAQAADQAEDTQPDWFATRILDARTLKPIAGARWIRTPESIAGWRLHHDVVLATAVTDAEGVAYLPTDAEACAGDCHWLVRAPGYATSHDYGVRPEPETLLEPEFVQRGRILDPLGRPVAGARVEHLGGCSHGTAASQAVAGADGTFLLKRLPESLGGQLWIQGPGIAATLLALSHLDSSGADGVNIVLRPGWRLTGRLVDLLGRPIHGAVIRAWNAQRGPTALSDAQGRFVIDGVEEDTSLCVYAPGDLLDGDGDRRVDGVRPDTPINLVVSPLGIVEEDTTASVRLRARGPDGKVVGGVTCCLVSVTTGLGSTCYTAEVHAAGTEASDLENGIDLVAPGRYRIVPDGPFDRYTFDPVEVTAVADTMVEVEIVVRPRPRLRVEGTIPDDAELLLAVSGPFVADGGEFEGSCPSLPKEGRAVVRVECEGRPAFFFPVGPEQDGVRTVTVALPLPRLLQIPVGAREVALRDGERDVVGFRQGEFYATDASGALTLTWEGADGETYELPIVVPESSDQVLPVNAGQAQAVAAPVSVIAVSPGEALPPVDEWEAAWPGETAAFERPGWRRLRAVVPSAKKLVLRWGTCTLRLEVTDVGEAPDALALIAGEVYALDEGTLELKGFEPGRFRILIARRDSLESVVEVHAVLKDRALTHCKVDLDAD